VTRPSALTDQIAALPDEQAVFVLHTVLERQGMIVDPFSHDKDEAHLREALAQPEITDEVTPELGVTNGDLARTALAHLAEDGASAGLIERAITQRPTGERDFGLLLVGSLVLFAFHSDIKLERDPQKGWSFHFKTKPLSGTAIAKALGQLVGFYTR